MFNLATFVNVILAFGMFVWMVGVLWLIFAVLYQTRSESEVNS